MKKYIFLLLAFICTPLFVSASTISTSEGESSSVRSGAKFILETFGTLQTAQHTLAEKEVALKFEKELTFPSLTEIEKIDAQLTIKFDERDTLAEKEGEDYEGLYVLDEQIQDLKINRDSYETVYQNRKARQQENIREYSSDIEDLKEEVDKQKQFIRTQTQKLMYWFLIFIGILLLLFGLKIISQRFINRLTKDSPESRQETLLRISNLIFNCLIVLVIIGILFSQITSLLPFIAIFGTGIAFAVRDALSSLVGWFVIGTERGFRVGDILKVGNIVGKVSDIGPFITSIQDLENGIITGSVSSFSNKTIFEEEITNLSRSYQFLEKKVSFLLSAESDLKEAESLLLSTVNNLLYSHQEELESFTRRLTHKTGFDERALLPQIHWENDTHGIKINITFLGRLEWIDEISSLLVREYTKEVRKKKNVFLQYTESQKKNETVQKSSPKKQEVHLH